MASKEKIKQQKKEYDEKRAGKRTRNWVAVAYPEDLPDCWQDIIDQRMVPWVEGPVHDLDLNANGERKKAHVHLLFCFGAVKHEDQVIEFFKDCFGESENGSIVGVAKPQMCSDRRATVRYMAHLDNPEKVQYNAENIKAHGGVNLQELLNSSITDLEEQISAVHDIIEHEDIIEFWDLMEYLRHNDGNLFVFVAARYTRYFSELVRSRRHRAEQRPAAPAPVLVADPATGEVMQE